jgi:2-amino-4-hydroxy-6-hydroxymethyldihydropteridine diphosphokinase
MQKEIFLLLGSNLGNREEYLFLARNYIKQDLGKITKESSLYETEPWGFYSECMFLNQVLKIESEFTPHEILQKIKSIEMLIGRVNSEKKGYSSRAIDIDILLYGNEVVNTEKLIIPHAKLTERRFVLIPLVEIDGNVEHPISRKTMLGLLRECEDKMKVNIYIEKKT